MSVMALTEKEKDFLDLLEIGVHLTGRALFAYEAALYTSYPDLSGIDFSVRDLSEDHQKVKNGAHVRASKILSGGSGEGKQSKLDAIESYRLELRSARNSEYLVTLGEVIRGHRQVVQIGLGRKSVNVLESKESDQGEMVVFSVPKIHVNLPSVNVALSQMAKLSGLVIDKKEVTGKDGKDLNTVLKVEYV